MKLIRAKLFPGNHVSPQDVSTGMSHHMEGRELHPPSPWKRNGFYAIFLLCINHQTFTEEKWVYTGKYFYFSLCFWEDTTQDFIHLCHLPSPQ